MSKRQPRTGGSNEGTGKAHEALAGPDPEPMKEDQTGSDSGKLHVSLAGPNPEHMDDEFLATAYPKVHENLKLITDERVIDDNSESHSGSMSSMKNLEDTDNFGDQFLYDKPTEVDQEKSKVVDESDSTIPDQSHQTVTSTPPVIAPFTEFSYPKPSSLVTPPPINTEATTITPSLPEITPFIALQLRVARLEQEMSEVKKSDHSTNVLATIKSQVPTAVDKYLGTKLDDALLKVLKRVRVYPESRIKNLKRVRRVRRRLSETETTNGIGQRFSLNKSSAVHEKPHTPRSCLRWKPTGRIFKTVRLRWIPTGKVFIDSTTKVDSEPPNGSNDDITNPYECNQTLYVSAGTSNSSAEAVAREVKLPCRIVSESEPRAHTKRQSCIASEIPLSVSRRGLLIHLKKLKGPQSSYRVSSEGLDPSQGFLMRKAHEALLAPDLSHKRRRIDKISVKLNGTKRVIDDNSVKFISARFHHENLEDTDNFGDQFLYDKPTEVDQEKSKVVDESDSTIPDQKATTITPSLPEITPFIALQLRVARLEQEMSEVKKSDHSTNVLALIKSQVPTAMLI
ncbi:hypothetical protein Tco_0441227 [Tanacetum coccineum]